jgi:hypothetical protein
MADSNSPCRQHVPNRQPDEVISCRQEALPVLLLLLLQLLLHTGYVKRAAPGFALLLAELCSQSKCYQPTR